MAIEVILVFEAPVGYFLKMGREGKRAPDKQVKTGEKLVLGLSLFGKWVVILSGVGR